MIIHIGNAFLLLFFGDALLSVLDGTLALPGISFLRSGIAMTVLWVAIPLYACLVFSTRLPARIFLPLLLVLSWLSLGAAPLVQWTGLEKLGLVASWVQLAAGASALIAVRSSMPGASWLLDPAHSASSGFSIPRFVGLGIVVPLLVPPLLVGYVLLAATSYLETATAQFISFDWEGINLSQRTYAQGDREIELIGMMHIGEEKLYETLFDSFEREGTIVLEEGVSDRGDLLAGALSYEKIATQLGLSQQGSIAAHFADDPSREWPHLRAADLDTADFSPQTIALLLQVAEIWQADQLREAFEIASALSVRPEVLEGVQRDLIEMRNQHLLDEIDSALGDYPRVVVPWGALHMRWIEAQVRARGFALVRSEEHPLVSFRSVAEAVF